MKLDYRRDSVLAGTSRVKIARGGEWHVLGTELQRTDFVSTLLDVNLAEALTTCGHHDQHPSHCVEK